MSLGLFLETKEKQKIYNVVKDSLIILSSILEKQKILSVRKLITIIMKSITKII